MAGAVSLGRVGLVGAGSMAQAVAHGLIESGRVAAADIFVNNLRNPERLRRIVALGAQHAEDKGSLCTHADLIVLTVKPKDVAAACAELVPHIAPRHLVISLAAGVASDFVASALGGHARVVRAMPNTSSAIRASATAIAVSRHAPPEDVRLAQELLGVLGPVQVVGEHQMDAVTALSGSGPAYVYLMLESLIEAGVAAGLARSVAHALALQTVYGASRMALESGVEPEELRQRVASPGGTTVAALGVFEEAGFRDTVVRAVRRAQERAGEIAAGLAAAGR